VRHLITATWDHNWIAPNTDETLRRHAHVREGSPLLAKPSARTPITNLKSFGLGGSDERVAADVQHQSVRFESLLRFERWPCSFPRLNYLFHGAAGDEIADDNSSRHDLRDAGWRNRMCCDARGSSSDRVERSTAERVTWPTCAALYFEKDETPHRARYVLPAWTSCANSDYQKSIRSGVGHTGKNCDKVVSQFSALLQLDAEKHAPTSLIEEGTYMHYQRWSAYIMWALFCWYFPLCGERLDGPSQART